jgi:hypothetical protein
VYRTNTVSESVQLRPTESSRVSDISSTGPSFCLWLHPPAAPMDLASQVLLPDRSEGGKESWEMEMNRISLGNDCASSAFLPKITNCRISTDLGIEHSRAVTTIVTAPILPLYVTCQAVFGLMLPDFGYWSAYADVCCMVDLEGLFTLPILMIGWTGGEGLRGSRQAP